MERRGEQGVTLLEMIVVVAIIAVMAAVTFPSATSGIDSIRLAGAADSVAALLQSGVNRADRRQAVVEITVNKPENAVVLRSLPDYERRYKLPDSVRIAAVQPEIPVMLYPGGAPPRMAIRLINQKGAQRVVSLDPITGTSLVEKVANEK